MRMKKNIITSVILAAALISAASCDSKPAETTKASAAQTTAAVQTVSDVKAADITAAVLEEIPIASAFEKSKETLEDYFDKMDTATIADFSYWMCASGAYPDEIAVFRFDSSDSATAAVSAVEARLQDQKDLYETYTPDEFYKLQGAIIKQSGDWVYYIVTSDNARAEEIIKSKLG